MIYYLIMKVDKKFKTIEIYLLIIQDLDVIFGVTQMKTLKKFVLLHMKKLLLQQTMKTIHHIYLVILIWIYIMIQKENRKLSFLFFL